MAVIKGLDALAKVQAEEKTQRGTPDMYVRLSAGDSARIRFLTEGSDIVTAQYHQVNTGRRSRGGKPIFELTYCGWDDGEDCKYCSQPESRDTGRFRRMNAYVWVYEIRRADGKKEPVNSIKVLNTGPGKSGYITAMFQTFLRKYGTLVDRDYEWARTGATQDDTVYQLVPEDKGPAPEAAAKALQGLPTLLDVAERKAMFAVAGNKETGGGPPAAGTVKRSSETPPSPRSLLERLRQKPTLPQQQTEEQLGEEL